MKNYFILRKDDGENITDTLLKVSTREEAIDYVLKNCCLEDDDLDTTFEIISIPEKNVHIVKNVNNIDLQKREQGEMEKDVFISEDGQILLSCVEGNTVDFVSQEFIDFVQRESILYADLETDILNWNLFTAIKEYGDKIVLRNRKHIRHIFPSDMAEFEDEVVLMATDYCDLDEVVAYVFKKGILKYESRNLLFLRNGDDGIFFNEKTGRIEDEDSGESFESEIEAYEFLTKEDYGGFIADVWYAYEEGRDC